MIDATLLDSIETIRLDKDLCIRGRIARGAER
jgi:hypothetical protein